MQARRPSEALLLFGRKKERGSETKKIPSCRKEGRKEGKVKEERKKERQTKTARASMLKFCRVPRLCVDKLQNKP
jgi:hypothetical protein